MKAVGIKYLLRATTLIPVFFVALMLAFFYNAQFSKDLDQHLSRLGEAYIRQLLPAAQFAILRQDNRTLQGLINASTVNPDIKALAFYNASGHLLAYRGGKHALNSPFTPPPFTGDYIDSKLVDGFTMNFLAPITVPRFNLYKTSSFQQIPSPLNFHADDIIGWLSIDVDKQPLLIKRYQMIVVTIFITLIGLLTGLTIHYFLSQRIYLPISRLRRSMRQILNNEFETRIRLTSKGELGVIEQGCAHLQKQYLSTIEDLNQHIEVATEDLQQSLELLEEKNIELTLEKKRNEEKTRRKSEFIANMSHEIRTPLNGVIGFTNVLLETRLDPLQLDYVKTINASASDLLTVINDILDYSKIDAGKLELDAIPFDIRHCIDEVLVLAAPNAHKKGLDLIPVTEACVPATLLGDPFRIKQIISNLINNAVRFTDQGQVSIRAKIAEETEKKYVLSLSVIDTGRGLSEQEQKRLFTAFQQADTTVTRKYGGSGLGLVICKKLAEKMQGKIILTSELHQGSTFTVQFTVDKLSTYEKYHDQRFSHVTAICFDDNPLYVESMVNGVAFSGMQAIPVQSYEALHEVMSEYKPNTIALLNVNQNDVAKVTEFVKHHPNIPCILLSKWPIADHHLIGAKGFLFKPLSIQKLHESIESIINKQPFLLDKNNLDNLRSQLTNLQPKVLLAEDNSVNRYLLHSLLNDCCSVFQTVEDGVAAVKISDEQSFDIILLDLQMPDMNGIDAARKIHENSLLNRKTPIAIISASNNRLQYKEMQMAGIALWIQKPIEERDLLSTLLQLSQSKPSLSIDWKLCIKKASSKVSVAEELLKTFIEELQKNREEFPILFDTNIQELHHAAHKLQGARCFCGVPELQKKTILVEEYSQSMQYSQPLKNAFEAMMFEIDRVLADYAILNKTFMKTLETEQT